MRPGPSPRPIPGEPVLDNPRLCDGISSTLGDGGHRIGTQGIGLHDSLVNHLGNTVPQMLLCLHEEHAVALAQGWAKVTGTPLAVAVHSNVGLFHATMAIFNAWCDRMPVLVIGATGPVDAARRRPWIDWIHTARDQGAIIRNYTKWDDQPASPAAAQEVAHAERADRRLVTTPERPRGAHQPARQQLRRNMSEAGIADRRQTGHDVGHGIARKRAVPEHGPSLGRKRR